MGLNSYKSLEEFNELTLIRNSISILPQDNGKHIVQVDFPFLIDTSKFFSPEKSNFKQACATTRSLFSKLRKIHLHNDFHQEILNGIERGHMVLIPPEETQQYLAQPHCISFLNYVCKTSSESTP